MSTLLTSSNILILSPGQKWSSVPVSKHHYAVALAERGNTVYFLNPIQRGLVSKVTVARTEVHSNVYTVDCASPLPMYSRFYLDKFKARKIFELGIGWMVRKVCAELPALDVVWSFDNLIIFTDLTQFPVRLRIWHPVDQVLSPHKHRAAESADLIFSIADNILSGLTSSATPRIFLDHGLPHRFAKRARAVLAGELPYWHPRDTPLNVGYVGNLTLGDVLDRKTLKKLIDDHSEVHFHFFGPTDTARYNMGATAEIDVIKEANAATFSAHNVTLHGPVLGDDLVERLNQMDALLLAYDSRYDINEGSNSHKILEYLSTGRVVISNHIQAYRGRPGLLEMVQEPDNRRLPDLFAKVVGNLSHYNSEDHQRQRISFALQNTYEEQVRRVEEQIARRSL